MESFCYGSAFNVERAKKGDKNFFFHLRKITNLFRVMELFVVLVVLSRLSYQLPDAFRSSGEYFKDFKDTVFSPRFTFVIGNVIVITLFAKSGWLSGQDSASKNDFYDEFIGKSGRRNHRTIRQQGNCYQDKQVVFEKVNHARWDIDIPHCSSEFKAAAYRRTQSVKLIRKQYEKPNYELRRSATEKRVKRVHSSEKLALEGPFPEDSLSNDEFRQKVEAFIARQQRFLRDEEYSVM